MLHLDNTKRSDFVSCPRKYFNKWHRRITPHKGSTALRYGVAFHSCMEAFYDVIADKGWTSLEEAIRAGAFAGQEKFNEETLRFEFYDDYRTLQNLLWAYMEYINHFHADEGHLKILETEKTFKIEIQPTPLEEHIYPGIEPFYFTGKIDLMVLLNGMNWLCEFKTTGQNLKLQSLRLHRSPQVMGYTYAGRRIFKDKQLPDGSLIMIHMLTAYKSRSKDPAKAGTYGKPKVDFSRQPESYTMEDMANFRLGFVRDAWHIQQAVAYGGWSMNQYSCYQFGQCQYLNLCEQGRALGLEVLGEKFFIDDNPWDVLTEGIKKDNIVEATDDEEEVQLWQENQQRVLPWTVHG